MTISLTLPPETQQELEQRAEAAGVDVSRYILGVVKEKLGEPSGASADARSAEEWIADFESWVARQRSHNPHFDDSRDSIYD